MRVVLEPKVGLMAVKNACGLVTDHLTRTTYTLHLAVAIEVLRPLVAAAIPVVKAPSTT